MKQPFYIKGSGESFGKLNKQLATIRAQRDALLEALKEIDELLSGNLPITAQAKEIAQAAIKELKP